MKKINIMKRLASQHGLRYSVPVLIVLLFVACLAAIQLAASLGDKQSGPDAAAYKEQLRSQVEGPDGTPNSGRDPASQGQTSLADAASRPAGAGSRTDTPAAGVTGDHNTHNTSGDVYGDANQTGVNSAGCYIDYGVQGQECLPAHAAGSDGKLTCGEVRQHFPKGVKVTGTDRFKLDANGDKLACGSGE